LALRLTVAEGTLAGREFELETGALALGRDESCGARFASAVGVSRRHAEVRHEDGAWRVFDLGSTNGTLLNGEPVEQAELQDGDTIQLGGEGPVLRVALAAAAALVTPEAPAPSAAPPSLIDAALYDPRRDKGRRYNASSLLVVFGMLGAGLFLGLLMALVSIFSLGLGAALIGVGIAFAAAPFYLAVWLWLDRNDPEPAWVLAATFVWGAGAATFVSGIVNDVFQGTLHALTQNAMLASFLSGSVSAPLIEEATKGLGVLLIFLFLRREFDGVIDGIVYAGVVALGFATVENVLYYGRAVTEQGFGGLFVVFFLRGVLGPFSHAIYTSMTGIGLGIARETHASALRVLAPLLGFGAAVFLHALWNTLAAVAGAGFLLAYLFFWAPLFLVFLGVVVWMGQRESRLIRRMLEPEVEVGLLSRELADRVASWRGRLAWTLSALGDLGLLRARHQLTYAATRLALSYWHVERAQAAGGFTLSFEQIPRLRAEVESLRARV